MPDIKVVIGSNFGDEGKGLFVHKFAYEAKLKNQKCIVVMSNGGAQRGHTVDLSQGVSHIFKHFGSGTFDNADTYFSHYFILNPMEFVEEYNNLVSDYKIIPTVYCSGYCQFTTPFDMIINQIVTQDEHSSCGMGIWETVARYAINKEFSQYFYAFASSTREEQKAYIINLRDNYFIDRLKNNYHINEIPDKWKDIYYSDTLIEHYLDDVTFMKNHISDWRFPYQNYDVVIFENGQGLLLDGDNKFYGEHFTTPSHTGCINSYKILKDCYLKENENIELCYVSRSYMTRHGDGRFETECDKNLINPNMCDVHNITNEFQGALRYGQLNTDGLIERINNDSKIFYKDFNNVKTSVGITHMNEFELDISKLKTNGTIYTSYSPFITEKKIGVEKI